jgi:hypothetical protein
MLVIVGETVDTVKQGREVGGEATKNCPETLTYKCAGSNCRCNLSKR